MSELFSPHMPRVDVPPIPDINTVFREARKMAGSRGERQIAVVTPGRLITSIPCPPSGSMKQEHITPIARMVPPQPSRNITVIAYNQLDAQLSDPARAIPFLGYLVGMGYIGHNVIVFEGHESVIRVGCQDADVVILDAQMIPHLHENWLHDVREAMRGDLIFAFNPNGTLTDYSRSDTTTDIPDDVQPYFEKAVLAIRNRRFEDALTILNEAIATNPTVARLYFNRGDVLADMERREEAIADYTRVTELQPENAEAYYNRAVTYQEMQNRKQAFADFSQAIRLNAEHYAAYVNRGGILLHAGQLDKAIEDFTRAISINPQGFHAFLYRGRAYVKRGAYEQAIVDFNRSNAIQPQYDTLLDRAEAYAAADKSKEAIADYEEFLRTGGGRRFGNQADVQARIKELKKKRRWF